MEALLVVAIVAIVLLVAVLVWYFSDEQVALRKLESAPRKKIGDVKEGEIVKITGRLELCTPPLHAPLSGRECAFFETTVEESVKRGKSRSWRMRIRESDVREFCVVDDTGKAMIEVANSRVVAVKDHHQTSGFLDDATPELEAYLARHGYTSTGLLGFNRTMRYREAVLEAGEEVAVLGRARWELDPDRTTERAGYRGAAKRLVLEAPAPENELLASDDPSTL